MIGPALPPGFKRPENSDEEKSNKEEQPQIENENDNKPEEKPAKRSYGVFAGPPRPTDEQSSQKEQEFEEDVVVGPVRPNPEEFAKYEARKAAIEQQERENEIQRWQNIRDGKTASGEKKQKREEWMLSLPEGKNQLFTTGPRQFSKSGNVGQLDKSWTDTPNSNNSSTRRTVEQEKELFEQQRAAHQNKATEKALAEHQKNRTKSLVEIHQEKLAKQKTASKGSAAPAGYVRPFDREKDLLNRQMDSGRANDLIKRSRDLNSNFESGSSKYH